MVYSFCSDQNCPDGLWPFASLIDENGMLYGTTFAGGAGNGGTVFALDLSSRKETVVYSFCSQQNCSDGAAPQASLIDVKGTLYGTAGGGGTHGFGTVFSLNPKTGAETVLYSFCSQANCADGAYPVSSLIDVNGLLYRTTYEGGTTGCVADGCGTVFSIDPGTGAETVLHAFCSQANCTDGGYPEADLIEVKGMLYGTTYEGGLYACGTVFALKTR